MSVLKVIDYLLKYIERNDEMGKATSAEDLVKRLEIYNEYSTNANDMTREEITREVRTSNPNNYRGRPLTTLNDLLEQAALKNIKKQYDAKRRF